MFGRYVVGLLRRLSLTSAIATRAQYYSEQAGVVSDHIDQCVRCSITDYVRWLPVGWLPPAAPFLTVADVHLAGCTA